LVWAPSTRRPFRFWASKIGRPKETANLLSLQASSVSQPQNEMGLKTYLGYDGFKPRATLSLSRVFLSLKNWDEVHHGEDVMFEGSWRWPYIGVGHGWVDKSEKCG
jgi:hypothetical protein